MTNFKACEEVPLRWYGRTHYDAIKKVHWFNLSCSGFAFTFDGTSASGVLKAGRFDDEQYRPYIAVFLDGETDPYNAKIIPLTQEENIVAFAENLPRGRHTVKVLKITEQTIDEVGSSRAGLIGLSTDGEFLDPPAASERRIEFYGDSITCGYGVGVTDETTFTTSTENGLLSYAGLCASMLGADANMVCASGWPLVKNGWSDVRLSTRVDTVDFSRDEKWDFSLFVPQVVVINLGTNDENYLAPLSGEALKKAKTEYLRAYEALVRHLNDVYGGVKIVAIWGMMCAPTAQVNDADWRIMLARLRGDDISITPLRLPSTLQNPSDERLGHPGPLTHRKAAATLAAHISSITGWEIEGNR